MKKFIYIIIGFLLFSCSNKNELKSVSESVVFSEKSATTFTNHNLTKEKLQDYYDLLVLYAGNTKFKEDVYTQLQKFSNTIKILPKTDKATIKNLKLLEIIKIGDSIEKIKISFDVVLFDQIKKDSIIVMIKNKKVIVDGNEYQSKKVTFKKLL